MTIRELLVTPSTLRPVLRGYDEYADLPAAAEIRVCPLREIATEKLVAIADPVRNEPHDLYDLWFLLEGKHVELGGVAEGFARKLAFKGLAEASPGEALARKTARLKRDWERRLVNQMVILTPFDGVVRTVRRHFRQLGLR